MKYAISTIFIVLLMTLSVNAQITAEQVESSIPTHNPEWTNSNESDPGTAGGNVETEFKVEQGEKSTNSGDPDRPLIEGGVPNLADSKEQDKESSNWIRTNQLPAGSESDSGETSQHNQTDLEFLKERGMSVSAVEVRGWDPVKKSTLLDDVKEWAEVKSEEDLESFVTGIILVDDNVESITLNFNKIRFNYKFPAKFLGLFNTALPSTTEVDGEGRVKVKYPWYSFLYSKFVKLGDIKGESQNALDEAFHVSESNKEMSSTLATVARTLEVLSQTTESLHDTAMQIIRNIK